tara:strand:- start:343 stop:492 length:150 start_codon:yes stop_codon:yes gene_type:complete
MTKSYAQWVQDMELRYDVMPPWFNRDADRHREFIEYVEREEAKVEADGC